jgi:hypothetical protein
MSWIAAGVIFGTYLGNKSGGRSNPVPEQQPYGEAMREGLQAQIDLAPDMFAAEKEFAPQKQDLDMELLRNALFGSDTQQGLLDMYGGPGTGARVQESGMGEFSRDQASLDQRSKVEGDMALIKEYGAEAREAFKQDNPLLDALEADALGTVGGEGQSSELVSGLEQSALEGLQGQSTDPMVALMEQSAMQGIQGQSNDPMVALMERDAMQALEQGGRLSSSQKRELSQPILAQYAAAGRTMDNASMQDLFRRTDDVRNQRMNEARVYGTQLTGMRDQRLNESRAFGAHLTGQRDQRLNQARASGTQLAGMQDQRLNQSRAYGTRVAGMHQQFDPMLAILGRQGAGQQLYGQQMGTAGGLNPGQVFNPEAGAGYNSQIYANQVSLAGSLASANAQERAGAYGAGGQIASAWMQKYCHVAREVYGETNPRWLEFFFWKELDGPKWFRNLYNRHSERIAKFISNKPRLKNLIRRWMDKRIA